MFSSQIQKSRPRGVCLTDTDLQVFVSVEAMGVEEGRIELEMVYLE